MIDNKKITVDELVAKTTEIQQLFRQIEKRPWTVETFAIELAAEVGTLTDSIMIKEGYRNPRRGQDEIDLQDDISDVIFVLIMIANYYQIDIGESYMSMIDATRHKLESIIKDRS